MGDHIGDKTQSIFRNILEQQFLDQLVNVRVLGDWMFTGKLVKIIAKQGICLADVTVTSCGGLTLCSFDVNNVSIQLEDVTSIGKPA